MEEFIKETNLTLCKATYKRESIENVLAILKNFEKHLKKANDISAIIEDHNDMLLSIQYNLYFLISEKGNSSFKKDLLDCRNRIFLSKLPGVKPIDLMQKVTTIFNDFIKGITWFISEKRYKLTEPAYHRDGSCPARGGLNPTCTLFDNVNADVIEKCYIERLIYDNIWQVVMMCAQDKEHQNWLEETRKAYKTCFPNTILEIKVQYSDKKYIEHIPERLTVTKTNVLLYSVEEYKYTKEYSYQKRIYVYPVRCVKYVGRNTYRKNTYYIEDDVWKLQPVKTLKQHASA
jgi:hypothetical protein